MTDFLPWEKQRGNAACGAGIQSCTGSVLSPLVLRVTFCTEIISGKIDGSADLAIRLHPNLASGIVVLEDHVFEPTVDSINPVVIWRLVGRNHRQPIVRFEPCWFGLKIDFSAIG